MGEESNTSKGVEGKSKPYIKEVLGWIEVVLIALVISALIRGFVFETTRVSMSSMEDTLKENETLILLKSAYLFSTPQRGDIIAFEHQPGSFQGVWKYLVPIPNPGEVDYIKRVIALPGEKIDIHDGGVYINGKLLKEPYVNGITDPKDTDFPRVVPENSVFVMGDHREVSSDSRQIGFIPMNKIRGKAVWRVYPLNRMGSLYQ